jgi:hypothetical protein
MADSAYGALYSETAMHEELPPTTGQRLPEIYTSPDKTVDEVASRPLPPVEPARGQMRRSRSDFGPVISTTIDPGVLRHARRMVGQELGRLVFRQDGSVIVANSPAHARLIREKPHFDTGDT